MPRQIFMAFASGPGGFFLLLEQKPQDCQNVFPTKLSPDCDIGHLRLRDFRITPGWCRIFPPGFHVLLGDNARQDQHLEAIYLMATCARSAVLGARTWSPRQKGYFVGGKVVGAATMNQIYWSARRAQNLVSITSPSAS